MTYKEAVARLYSLEQTGIKLGLDNIRDFCGRLGNPQDQFLSVHIAGTNGKGSVTALIAETLRRDGWRVGRYTSPHLRDFRERIEISGHPISPARVTRFVEHHWPLIVRKRYSYFEVVTAMAFHAFARDRIDIGVIEVGLGGRFDATNILDPALSIITQIDFDHERILGHTLPKIAFEKSGIIKTGRPVLLGPVSPDVREVLERIAQRKSAPIFEARSILNDRYLPGSKSITRKHWRFPLFGVHQNRNLGIALAALFLLRDSGVTIGATSLHVGASHVHWPGRFQFSDTRPLAVFDVAHNPSGARAFADTWRGRFGHRRGTFVFTTKDDKGYDAMWRSMAPLASTWIGCPLPHSQGIPRARMERMANGSQTPFVWCNSAHAALKKAQQLAGADGIIAVVGSHYLVGELIPPTLLSPPDGGAPRHCQFLKWGDILTALRPAGGR